MKNRIFVPFIGMLVLNFYSCRVSNVYFTVVDNKQSLKYGLSIPKGFQKRMHLFENGRTILFVYPDSSLLYFSDNTKPSAFLSDAYNKYGKDINIKFLISDTITICGVDSSGNYWKDRKNKKVVYGYRNVVPDRKSTFDNIVNNLIMPKNKL
jgi:hypothetical protein